MKKKRAYNQYAVTNQNLIDKNEQAGSKPLKNIRQELFTTYLVSGMTKWDAYRKAGYESSNPSSGAIVLLKRKKIQDRLTYLQRNLRQDLNITPDTQVKRFREISNIAINNGQMSAAVAAEDKLSMILGLYEADNSQKAPKMLMVIGSPDDGSG